MNILERAQAAGRSCERMTVQELVKSTRQDRIRAIGKDMIIAWWDVYWKGVALTVAKGVIR